MSWTFRDVPRIMVLGSFGTILTLLAGITAFERLFPSVRFDLAHATRHGHAVTRHGHAVTQHRRAVTQHRLTATQHRRTPLNIGSQPLNMGALTLDMGVISFFKQIAP